MAMTILFLLSLALVLSVSVATPFSGYVAMDTDGTQVKDSEGNVVSIEYVAGGEAMIGDEAMSFNTGVVYDNFDENGEYFDGTIDMLMDGGNVITVKFSSASIGNELDKGGFFTILPSPLQGQIIGGRKKYRKATGSIELRGRLLPGGHGPTFYNFDGEIILSRRLVGDDDIEDDRKKRLRT